MATWYLMNTIRVGTRQHFAGEYIDDAIESTAALISAGAKLVASATTGMATAAGEAQAAVKRGNSAIAESIMNAALDATQGATLLSQDTVDAATATNAATVASKVFALGAPAAPNTTAVHAGFAGNDAASAFPGPFTNPDQPRNATVTFAAGWDGGDVDLAGTDHFDAAQTELFASNPGATSAGTKTWKTITGATKSAVGAAADTASIGTGKIVGIIDSTGAGVVLDDTAGMLTADGVGEAGSFDSVNNSVDPTTAPDGSVEFAVVVNVEHTHTQAAHTHTLS